ncbi:MAG TPA: YciI family protein [Paludibaculum sp.]|jgi:uncharacterized protein YciI
MFRAALFLTILAVAPVRAEVYCFGFLNAHPDRKELPKEEAEAIQAGHMGHMQKMNAAGRLLTAGPIATPGNSRGILVYRCKNVAEAEAWTALDPTVVNKRLTSEFYRWQGPDGFGEPLMTALKADPKAKYEMVKLPLIVFRKTAKWTGAGPADVLREHGGVVRGLLQEGKLRAAGPFVDEQGKVGLVPGAIGIYVFAAMPIEDARALVEKDPMVREGYARLDVLEWFVANEAVPAAARKP